MAQVGILGASSSMARYSHQAQLALARAGYGVIPITPRELVVLGVACYPDLAAVRAAGLQPAAITLYINPQHLAKQLDDLIALAPQVVIANPGTEDDAQFAYLAAQGIRVVQGCTLVMLSTQTFDRVLDGA